MIFANRISKIALLFLLSINIIQTQDVAENISNAPQTVDSELVAFFENALQHIYSLPNKLDRIAEQLALLVSKHQIKNITQKDAIIACLRDVRMIVGETLKDQAVINTIKDPELQGQIAVALLQLCGALTHYLDNAIKTNLKDLKPFDITPLTKRSVAITNVTPKQLSATLEMMQQKIDRLEKKCESVGLTWYNKATRKFERFIVDPCKKYHIPTIALIGASTAFVTLWLAWEFGHEYVGKKIVDENDNFTRFAGTGEDGTIIISPSWMPKSCTTGLEKIINLIGRPMTQHENGQYELFNDNIHGVTSKIDKALRQLLSNHFPHITLAGGFTFGAYKTAWNDSLKPWVTKKGNKAWNFMRGGAYEQKAVNGVWDFDPKVTFDDMVGLDEVKQQFSFIINFLDNPEQYLRVHTAPETGWLLTGPPRTGKSFSVECLCGEIARMLEKRGRKDDFKFWKIDAALIHQYGIADILETAKSNAPIVLFIDEIDLLGLQRVGNNQLLSQFLTSMQSTMDTDPSKQVILIAATNKPETLDKALRQNGRLGKEIRFEYPAFKYRKSYLMRELTNMALDINQFDLDSLSFKTTNKSFEDLRAIIRNSMIRAWMQGHPLTQEFLEESLDTELRHIIMVDRKDLSEQEKRILATHFAGRALSMMLLNTHAHLDKVTTKAVMTDLKEEAQWDDLYKDEKDKQKMVKYGAMFTKHLEDTIRLSSHEQIVNEVKTLLAGFVAEEILLGSCSFKCHPESSNYAYRLIEELVFEGVDPKQLSKNVSRQLKDKAYSLFVQYKQEVAQLLKNNHETLQLVADALMEKSILTDKEVQAIMESVNTPKNVEETTETAPEVAPA